MAAAVSFEVVAVDKTTDDTNVIIGQAHFIKTVEDLHEALVGVSAHLRFGLAFPEVCAIFCATANPVDVLVAVTDRGRGIVGVIDGSPPVGAETDADVAARRSLLREIGYKL